MTTMFGGSRLGAPRSECRHADPTKTVETRKGKIALEVFTLTTLVK